MRARCSRYLSGETKPTLSRGASRPLRRPASIRLWFFMRLQLWRDVTESPPHLPSARAVTTRGPPKGGGPLITTSGLYARSDGTDYFLPGRGGDAGSQLSPAAIFCLT